MDWWNIGWNSILTLIAITALALSLWNFAREKRFKAIDIEGEIKLLDLEINALKEEKEKRRKEIENEDAATKAWLMHGGRVTEEEAREIFSEKIARKTREMEHEIGLKIREREIRKDALLKKRGVK